MVRRSAGKIWCGYFQLCIRCPRSTRAGGESLLWKRGFTAIVRAEDVCESVTRNRMKRIFTNLKNCGSVRCGAVAFVRVPAPVSALARCAGLAHCPLRQCGGTFGKEDCGSGGHAARMRRRERYGLCQSAMRFTDTRQR